MALLKYFTITLLCLISLSAAVQRCDAVQGKWVNNTGEVQITICKKDGLYYGKISWLKNTVGKNGHLLTDIHNIRPEERKRGIMNLEVLKNFICTGSGLTGGTIYDPRRGKNFKGEVRLIGSKLKITAMMGMFKVGDEIWTKVKQ